MAQDYVPEVSSRQAIFTRLVFPIWLSNLEKHFAIKTDVGCKGAMEAGGWQHYKLLGGRMVRQKAA